MSLFVPRMSSLGPLSAHPFRHEFGPFFNLFNDTFNELQKISTNADRTFSPRFDVKESKEAYTLEGELPGIDQKDIAIEFSDEQTLTIKGRTESYNETGERPRIEAPEAEEAPDAKATPDAKDDQSKTSESKEVAQQTTSAVTKAEEPKHTYWVSERSVGEFSRSFSFPSRVDHENIKASLKNGILSVVVPKKAKPTRSKRISIE